MISISAVAVKINFVQLPKKKLNSSHKSKHINKLLVS